jgi:hypothetical protein
MALDDLRYEHAVERPPEPDAPRPGILRWIAVAIAGLAAGSLLTFWWMSRAQPVTTAPASTTPADGVVGSNRPARQVMPLPPLSASDTFLSDLVSAISRHPAIVKWLATPGLIRAGVLAVVQVGDGRTPAVPLKALQPETRVQVTGGADGALDAQSYRRWEAAVRGLTSIEPAAAAQIYVNIKPLLDEAYQELGYPAGNFDDAVTRAIRVLAETTVAPEPPRLLRRPNYYEYEDPTLRAMVPVQKQFRLIGPDNRRQVMAWLRQFAAALDLPPI